MPRRSKIIFLPITIFTILVLALIYTANQQAFSQGSQALVLPPQLESIKITNPVPFQSVDVNKELTVTGESSDNTTKNCRAYVLVNGIQPYQSAVATGPGGATDYSQWEFVLHNQYTHLNDGNNKITAKLLCDTAPTRWYSVVVSGGPTSNVSQTVSEPIQTQSNVSESVSEPIESQSNVSETVSEPIQTQSNVSESVSEPIQTQSNVSETVSEPIESQSNVSESVSTETPQSNTETVSPEQSELGTESETETVSPEQSELGTESETVSPETQQSNTETETVSPEQPELGTETVTPENQQSGTETVTPEGQQELLVTVSLFKNPLARGDRQNTTITVMDSNQRPVANVQIDGKLIYPGDNFQKEFNGITDLDGKFVYSWIVGKKGDVGPLLMEVQASGQGYPPASAHSTFEIVESDESSKILDPFQSNFLP